jgi:hypothetical protein
MNTPRIESHDRKIIGFVSVANPMIDRRAWSGTFYKIREAIELAGYDVRWIRVHPNKTVSFLIKAILRILGQVKYWEYSGFFGWLCARSISLTAIKDCDYLFFPSSAQMITYLHKRLSGHCPPIIYYTDSTFRLMEGYYWFNIPGWISRQADAAEKNANDGSALVIKSSDWAINSVINDYGCPPEKTAVLEFGANIDEKDIVVTEPYSGGLLRVLFSGVDWKRKGADTAIETVKLLNENGIPAHLYLAGINESDIPPEYQHLAFVEYVGFLNKNNPLQYNQYTEVVRQCHCLLLPTHAECSSIVFNEASASGLPSFTYDTGGLANYVINGKNGYRLNIHASAADFANIIEKAVRNNEFAELRNGALTLYEEKNSWRAWSRRFAKLMESYFMDNLRK